MGRDATKSTFYCGNQNKAVVILFDFCKLERGFDISLCNPVAVVAVKLRDM